MLIIDERLRWYFWSVFYDVGLLAYARRGHMRNDAHCRSHARNVLSFLFWGSWIVSVLNLLAND